MKVTKEQKQEIVTSEQLEVHYEIPADERTKQIIFRLCHYHDFHGTYAARIAEKVWQKMCAASLGKTMEAKVTLSSTTDDITPEEWNALEASIEEEKIRAGEITPRVQEFMRSREQLNFSLRGLRERLQWEYTKVDTELMLEKDKQESKLYAEINTIVQDVARELGFHRPVTLEITRSQSFNAYVHLVSREGGMEKDNTIPLRIYVNAGLVDNLAEIMAKNGKQVTRDHIAAVIGHELAHLKQPAFHVDKSEDKERRQRYEYDADSEGMRAMDRAGYNPLAAIEVFQAFKEAHGGGGKWQEVLGHYVVGSHPITENRINELWQLYQRSDQPYFSAQKVQEPISEAARLETIKLLRHELLRQLDEVRGLADWEKIIERLESDPNMTLRDAEFIGQRLKMHMDARISLAVAAEELETNTGLAEALIYVANYSVQHKEKKWSDQNFLDYVFGEHHFSSGYYGNSNPIPKPMQGELFKDIVGSESSAVLRQEFHQRHRKPDGEGEVVKFVREHTANEVVGTIHFKTTADVFNENNPEAVKLWTGVLTANGYQFQDTTELMQKAKKFTLEKLGQVICFGNRQQASYSNDGLSAKEAFLKAFEEARAAAGEMTNPAKQEAWFDPAKLSKLKALITQRVAVYKRSDPSVSVPPPPEMPEQKDRHRTFHNFATLVQYPVSVHESAFTADDLEAANTTPLQRVVARYFRASRTIFNRTLSAEYGQSEFGLDVVDNPRAKQLLFEDLFKDFFFETEERDEKGRIGNLSIAELRTAPELFTYMRLLFATRGVLLSGGKEVVDYFNKRKNYYPNIGVGINFFPGDVEGAKNLDDFSHGLEMVRVRANHPWFARSGFDPGNGPEKEAKAAILQRGYESLKAKVALYNSFIRQGIFPEGTALPDRMQALLIARAQAKQLPPEYFLPPKPRDKRGWFKKLLGIGRGGNKPDSHAMIATLNRIFSEDFMRLMADDQEELHKCTPDTITVIEEK